MTSRPANRGQCFAKIYKPHHMRGVSCSKPATVHEDGKDWCKIHAPSEERARREKRNAEFKAESARRSMVWTLQSKAGAFRDALREIANGHNDPRVLAIAVLGDMLADDTPDGSSQTNSANKDRPHD